MTPDSGKEAVSKEAQLSKESSEETRPIDRKETVNRWRPNEGWKTGKFDMIYVSHRVRSWVRRSSHEGRDGPSGNAVESKQERNTRTPAQ
jgi:hypothetical protein